MSEPHVYTGILREEDGHMHIHIDGGQFLCLNRHDLDKSRVRFSVVKLYDSESVEEEL